MPSTPPHTPPSSPRTSRDVSFAPIPITDVSAITTVVVDASNASTTVTDVSGAGYDIRTTTTISDTSFLVHTVFTSHDPSGVVDISEDLTENITVYADDVGPSGENTALMEQIRVYASQINCDAFHGKGTVDDYAALFAAASNIAHETSQIQLNVDVSGFNEFAAAADELSALFQNFTLRLQSINIINDTTFLTAIASALSRIVNLANIFGKFKETILQTTTIQIPKSTYDTRVVLEGVMGEIQCAMDHIQYFVDPSSCATPLTDAALSTTEKNIINQAVVTIDNWNSICQQGVSIAMNNDPNIQYISQANVQIQQQTSSLRSATSALRNKISAMMW